MNVLIAYVLNYCLTHRLSFLNWKLVVYIGALSYALYVWQQLFVFTFKPLLAITINVVCAQISYLLVEKPCISLGRKLAMKNSEKINEHRAASLGASESGAKIFC